MNSTSLAYTGGILDGDGCITYTEYITKDKSKKISPRIIVTSSTSYNYICQLKETLDFETRINKLTARKYPTRKPLYVLNLRRSNILKFIEVVKPYTQHKGERLEALKQALLGNNVEENLKKIKKLNHYGTTLRKRKVLARKSKSV